MEKGWLEGTNSKSGGKWSQWIDLGAKETWIHPLPLRNQNPTSRIHIDIFISITPMSRPTSRNLPPTTISQPFLPLSTSIKNYLYLLPRRNYSFWM